MSAWFTLMGAVAELVAARDVRAPAARRPATHLDDAFAQPDLAHLLRELGPYFTGRRTTTDPRGVPGRRPRRRSPPLTPMGGALRAAP